MGMNGTGYLCFFADGRCLGTIQNLTVDIESTESKETYCNMKPDPIEVKLDIKRLRRKRLVKLLMSSGNNRNKANAIARTFGGNYEKNYLRYWLTGRVI